MAGEKFTGVTKRFGPRYGRSLKQRVEAVEKLQKATYSCPYCGYEKVKRVVSGIWQCKKCRAKFTNKAYTVEKVIVKGDIMKKEELIDIPKRKSKKKKLEEEYTEEEEKED